MGKLLIGSTIIAALLASTACIHQTEPPPLTGPSELGQSVKVTVTPDTLTLDGSQATVLVQVRDASGAAVPNVPLRLDVAVGNALVDCGQLSQHSLVTGSDGRASTRFTAPTLPLPMPECTGFAPGGTVLVTATPVGSDASTAVTYVAAVRMLDPSVIAAPGGPVVNFTMSATTAKVNQVVSFNASASTAGPGRTIVGYSWNFGDGVTKTGAVVSHDFGAPGDYNIVVTVTDDIGQQALKSALLTITP